jgi:Tfp pilus assembly protein PilX
MKRDEQGIALIITLFLMASLSALAVSMMFLSQTETASSRNYRTMSQARYAGEAGIHRAMNYLLYSYTAPTTYSSYGITQSPVTCVAGCTKTSVSTCDASSVPTAISSGCIVLVANFGGLTGNYPDAAVLNGFSDAAQGTLAVNASGSTTNTALGTASYGTAAILMSMRATTVYGGATGVVQTWQIISDGKAGPTSALATVEVVGTFERNIVPANTFAVFATNAGCKSLLYVGSGGTDSYDSTNMTLDAHGLPVVQLSGGGIGTNGNLDIGGAVMVNGSLSTPRTGVGDCTDGAVTAETRSGNATVSAGMIKLSEAKTYPTPVIPAPGTLDLDFSSGTMTGATCATIMSALGWSCLLSGSTFTIQPTVPGTPLLVHSLNIGSNRNLTIAGSGNVTIDANTFTTAGTSGLSITAGTVTMNLKGTGITAPSDTNPVMDMQGNFSTTAYDPTKLQIMYDGPGTIKLRGNNELAATIYAPNSFVDMSSSYDVYGSILSGKYSNSGGALVHYDRSLSSRYFTLSDPYMSAFTWKKY